MRLISRLCVAAFLVSGTASAQSAKIDMQMGQIKALAKPMSQVGAGEFGGPWTTIMTGAIHTSSQKDLVFGVSLVTSLMTDTTVASSRYNKDVSQAEGKIEVQVLVDGVLASPGPVVFDRRNQKLMAQFDGFSCDIAVDGTLSGCKYQDEILQLVLETEAAHAFFFGAPDVGTGDHVIQVQARTSTFATSQAGAAAATAFIGKGAFTVEEVRLVNGAGVEIPTL